MKDYRTYSLVYLDMPTDPGWYADCSGQKFGVLFSVKFLEAQPSV